MKFQIKITVAIIVVALALGSCSKNDEVPDSTGLGGLTLEFDAVYGTADLNLNELNGTTSLGDILKISNVKYIVSNIVLTKEDGTTFTYPKSESYFIVDEATKTTHVVELEKIPAGNYTKIKFGIGVDKAQYDLGETGQSTFYKTAQDIGMIDSWSTGYKNLLYEGLFTSATVTTSTAFVIQTEKSGTDYNYAEVTLDLPSQAMIRTTITPEIHIFVDVAKIIDGTNKIKLSDNYMAGMGWMNLNSTDISLIADNFTTMFTVGHVHNN